MLPAKFASGFRGVADETVYLRWAKILRIYFDEDPASRSLDAALGFAFALPHDLATSACKGLFNKFSHRVGFSGRQNVVVRLRLLQHKPHTFDVIARVSPVALRIEIAEIKLVLLAYVQSLRQPASSYA